MLPQAFVCQYPAWFYNCLQEALISHGGTKSEAAAAELLFKSLANKPNASEGDSPGAVLRGKTSSLTPGSTPRDAIVPAISSDSDAASAAASNDDGAASARGVAPSGAKGAAASAVGASPRDALIDYATFEQLWMADLTNPTKAV